MPLKHTLIESKLSNYQLNEVGIYIFKHTSGKIFRGSAMNFKRRLIDQLSSFKGHRIMQKIHSFTNKNGGINELTWCPLILTPNFYKLFISLNPNLVLNKGEIQILVALTQFMPRVLEQCYISHFNPELNGNKKGYYNVIFSLIKWNPDLLLNKSANELGQKGEEELNKKIFIEQ